MIFYPRKSNLQILNNMPSCLQVSANMFTLFLIVNGPHAFFKAGLEGITSGVTIDTGDRCGGDEQDGIFLYHDDLS